MAYMPLDKSKFYLETEKMTKIWAGMYTRTGTEMMKSRSWRKAWLPTMSPETASKTVRTGKSLPAKHPFMMKTGIYSVSWATSLTRKN